MNTSTRVGHRPFAQRFQATAGWLCLLAAWPLLWWVSQPALQPSLSPEQFFFWQIAVETIALVVVVLVFVTGYRASLSTRPDATILLGLGFLGVALLDYLHVLSHAGMPDLLTPNTAQKSAFLWLAARLLAALVLLAYTLLPASAHVTAAGRRLGLLGMLAATALLGYVALSVPWQTPAPLAVSLEWLVVLLNATALTCLVLRCRLLAQECLMALVFAAALSAVSELFFTPLGAGSRDSAQLIGHVYKLLACLFLFDATFNEALCRPLRRMRLQFEREKLILSASPDAVLWVAQDGVILMANRAAELLTGYSSVQLVGQNVSLFLPEHQRARHAKSMQDYFSAPHARAMGSRDLKLQRKDGNFVSVDISLGHWVEGGTAHAIAYMRDLSERKKFEESLRYQASHDELTGLANRWMLRLQLGQALARSARNGLRVAILFIDLDDFKSVNDTYGHAIGDSLLVQTGARIRALLRKSDTLARMGGDEFAILLSDMDDVEEAILVASKVLSQLQLPYPLQAHEIQSGGSIGLAFYPQDARNSDALLRCADIAMYQAKHAGRGTYACYSSEMGDRAHEQMLLHTRLKEAMAQGRLRLHYQPQLDIASGTIVGAEALLRWNDPELGSISPARFIPMAEATGLILPWSEWVLQTACKQLAAWEKAGTPLEVSVNFSAQQFRHEGLAEQVQAALAQAGASARLLTIEITETLAMARPESARQQLQALVALGCHIALNDFGTGYSSLAYLKVLPVQKLKIDKRFMDGVPDDGNDVAIVGAIIALAHSLGLALVAEGVETALQLDFLRRIGCEAYQGWLYSKAIEADALTALLQQQQHAGAGHCAAFTPTI